MSRRELIEKIYVIVLLILVLAGWGAFLNYGDIPFDFHDWAEVNAPRLAFLKDAVTKWELPLHMPDASALRGITDRYFALPDVLISPQVLFLRWLSVGEFVLFHYSLMILLGYAGALRLKKRFRLGPVAFTWFVILFFFNGHILSHTAVGHVTWGGYFLFTWFAELLFQLTDGDESFGWIVRMAFLLFFIFLQGSFHQFVWCVLFLGFFALWNYRKLFTVLRSGILAGALSAFRILPPAMQMGAFDDDFLGGYRTPSVLLRAFTGIIRPADALDSSVTGQVLGWWESDLHIGWTAFVLLLMGGLCILLSRSVAGKWLPLWLPMVVLSLFSLRGVYQIMRVIPIPLFSGERVSSRFLILPFVFAIVLALTGLQWKVGARGNILLAVALIPALWEIRSHFEAWKVISAVEAFPYTYTDLSIKTVANHPDPSYFTSLGIGMAITLCAMIYILIRQNKKAA